MGAGRAEKWFALPGICCPMESVKRMQIILLTAACAVSLGAAGRAEAQAPAPAAPATLSKSLQDVYLYWRNAMVRKDYNAWQRITASHRRLAIQNRVMSEKAAWPASIFNLPAAPPPLAGLKLLRARSKGATAKLVYFGKVNFGVGGDPTDNLLVLSFVHEGRGWKYDAAEFVSLGKLKDVRRQIQSGNLAYVDGAAFLPDGKRPPQPIVVKRAKYIAKVYAYCPGREVQVSVNRISRHRFQDTQQAEVVIGGARDGRNELWFAVKDLPGYKGKDPLTVRVYLFSQVNKVQPVKVFQYQVEKGQQPKASMSTSFMVDAATGRKVLTGR